MASIFFLLIAAASISAQTSLTDAFDKLLNPYFKNNEPGGVIMVAKNGQVIYEKAFGIANMELNVPVNDSMIFYIASNTKQFTAVAILQLIEKGKIQLMDTLGKFIPSCSYPVGSITIQQLLSHTSGIGSNNENDKFRLMDKRGLKPIDFINYIVNLPMDFSPGTKWDYNNNGFEVLGYLIEKISGKSYADFVTENIFTPAGMLNTYMQKESSIIKNRPGGYTNFKTGIKNASILNMESVYAAGAIQSTVEDMLKWNRALKSGKLLKQETLRLAYTPQLLSNGQPTTYGLGWHLEELHGSLTYRHGGALPGFTSETLYLPKEDVYIVVLLNEETSKIPIVALARIIAGLTIEKPYNFDEVAIDKSNLQNFIGVYESENGELLNITEQNGKLIFQRPNGGINILHYAGNNEFFFDKDYLRAEFTSDKTNKIKSLKFSKVDIGMTEWVKTQKPLLKLSSERIADNLLKQYTGKYFLNNDTITINRDGPTLYYQTGNQAKQWLAPENNVLFFSLKEDLQIEFLKEQATDSQLKIAVTKNNKNKKYSKL